MCVDYNQEEEEKTTTKNNVKAKGQWWINDGRWFFFFFAAKCMRGDVDYSGGKGKVIMVIMIRFKWMIEKAIDRYWQFFFFFHPHTFLTHTPKKNSNGYWFKSFLLNK